MSLRDASAQAISKLNFGVATAAGSEIGTAKVRGFQYHSGTPGTALGQFKLYLFDIKMNTSKNFADVRSIFEANVGTNSSADIVLETNGNARLQEPSNNVLVLPFAFLGTKTLKDSSNNVDTQFVFRTEKTVTFSPGYGINLSATVSSNSAHAGRVESMNEPGT